MFQNVFIVSQKFFACYFKRCFAVTLLFVPYQGLLFIEMAKQTGLVTYTWKLDR